LGIAELVAAYRDGTARPSDVTRAYLDCIAAHDGKIGAFQSVYAEDAMRLAEASDKRFEANLPLSAFEGIPFVLKDICHVEGRVTTGGCRVNADRISTKTGTVAKRLLAAGGVLLGKTKTVEHALGGWGTNTQMGTPWNPWDLAVPRAPGGSSSGTGASVAAGFALCGVGTDTGGSVRLPASYCGIVGLKVTEGVLPTDGIIPLAHLDTPGPMARTVSDVWMMFEVMDGAEVTQPGPQSVEGLRLGVMDETERGLCDAAVLRDYDAALEVLSGLGAELAEFSAQTPYAQLTETCGRLIMAEAYFHHGHLYDQVDLPLDEDVRKRMLAGRDVAAHEYLAMKEERHAGAALFLARMKGFDAVLTPTTLTTAPPVAEIDQDVAPSHFTRPANFFGLCALSLPMGLAPDGLPTSLQIMARPSDETMALRIGAAYEAGRGPIAYPDLTA
jgi:aspartyl-tRNA(Asn)/glutamyl-tRNA(Gln) amidotransferase subunit A